MSTTFSSATTAPDDSDDTCAGNDGDEQSRRHLLMTTDDRRRPSHRTRDHSVPATPTSRVQEVERDGKEMVWDTRAGGGEEMMQ
ncbi:hypothetical protein D9613_009212 [Agrocybe pediades]|uniref:Uncharacterized protein n=1 Tax=Agrocybe pediades TaxID=84607 RepID=A0A8H4R378_9AGAR|nr:hypothetical protein D9613_009212 [Agrocybe pediades]